MATIAEWENHFKELTPSQRNEIRNALETLKHDSMFLKEMGWSGMFNLTYSLANTAIEDAGLKPCEAHVQFMKEPGRVFDHACCLFAPHPGIKHFTPTLLVTIGGERVNYDIHGKNITKTWSPYSNERTDE